MVGYYQNLTSEERANAEKVYETFKTLLQKYGQPEGQIEGLLEMAGDRYFSTLRENQVNVYRLHDKDGFSYFYSDPEKLLHFKDMKGIPAVFGGDGVNFQLFDMSPEQINDVLQMRKAVFDVERGDNFLNSEYDIALGDNYGDFDSDFDRFFFPDEIETDEIETIELIEFDDVNFEGENLSTLAPKEEVDLVEFSELEEVETFDDVNFEGENLSTLTPKEEVDLDILDKNISEQIYQSFTTILEEYGNRPLEAPEMLGLDIDNFVGWKSPNGDIRIHKREEVSPEERMIYSNLDDYKIIRTFYADVQTNGEIDVTHFKMSSDEIDKVIELAEEVQQGNYLETDLERDTELEMD